ncbi:hypothetical protein GLOTRDRAFT_97202 [Gloeophyllum trabeum ATCC 11539]|uniref:Fungal N-terminal domain-containing protein n=1 Tax=Gloeophyllum trabeum (strain ATCC 11539 / FP-39264 / Madison 617) TaxID=670483 RepID=S7PQQ6_GLOTA|nr:uncharacterized protein GLOTRDRAFT_97202 [Gloeophyllum trabeum ATCC 11539]EPQ50146.1 hypothetical protein GLOTRDRAFT_97202 [Gloeophyllum trabeum ATCC 11539]
MSISISFGSFGDIVSLIQLAASVISRLASSAGNSERYSELLLELHTLSGALASLQNKLHTPRAPSCMPSELRRDIEARIAACRASLEKMERNIVWQQQRLRGRYPKDWRDLWLRAGWRLFAEKELQRYREDARSHRDSVKFALSMLNRWVSFGFSTTRRAWRHAPHRRDSAFNTRQHISDVG